MCHYLDQSVVNHAIDEWRHHLSACVDAEGGHFENNYDCYSQNNSSKWQHYLITGDDFFCSILL